MYDSKDDKNWGPGHHAGARKPLLRPQAMNGEGNYSKYPFASSGDAYDIDDGFSAPLPKRTAGGDSWKPSRSGDKPEL